MLVAGKNAFVTGSNRGIGKAIVRKFSENGANIWACTRTSEEHAINYFKRLAIEHGVSIWPIAFDLSDVDDISRSANQVNLSGHSIDILVNNAGVLNTALLQMTSLKNMKEVFDINFFSQMLLTQLVIKSMCRQKSGSIVNITSTAAIDGPEGRISYAASKGALISATKVMAKELARYNIRVNAVAPGLTNTDMMTKSTTDKVLKDTLDRSCMKRVGEPEEIANVVLFLSSHLSSYVTGQVIRVDGGM